MNTKTAWVAVVAAAFAGNSGAAEALLAFVGDVDLAEISQSGYCGERQRINPDQLQRVAVQGDEKVWVFVKAVHRMGKQRSVCTVEREFVPASGEAYIVRVNHVPKHCVAEVLQAVAGADPKPTRSQRSERLGC